MTISTPARSVAPGPKGYPVFGSMPDIVRESTRLSACMRYFENHGDVVRLHFLNRLNHFFFHPDAVQHILQTNARNYQKSVDYEKLRPVLGNGLITSEGGFWLRQRRMMQPHFHMQRLARLADTMVETTAAALDRWEGHARTGTTFDAHEEMVHLTLNIVAKTLFGTELKTGIETVGRALPVALKYANDRMVALLPLPTWVPTPGQLASRKAIAEMDAVVYSIIESRRQSGVEGDDLLSMLIAARDEDTNEAMTDLQLRDEAMTIFLAGHETTANALSWALYLISRHPEVEARMRAEVDEVLEGRSPTFADLPRLAYVGRVFDEVLRLYPPVWFQERTSVEDDEVVGIHVPAGTDVAVLPWVTHRHPAFWEEPERFDPDRFLPERSEGRPKFAYFPFSGGQRVCIGNNFALMETKLVLTMITQRFRVRVVAPEVTPVPVVTLRPKGGVPVVVEARATS